MRTPALQERRNRQILADVVRTYIETGEPVSSRVISARFEETLSTATIRNVMGELEDGGFLFQPHTSAGRVPTAAAYRFFAHEIATQATLSTVDREWIQARNRRRDKRFGDYGTRGPCACRSIERTWHHRISADGQDGHRARADVVAARWARCRCFDFAWWKYARQNFASVRPFTQIELDATADFLNRHYSGWTLEAIRGDLLQKLANERERYEGIVQNALTLCDPVVLGEDRTCRFTSKARRRWSAPRDFSDQAQLRDVLAAIEEKHRLVTVLNACIEGPEPVHVQIGVKEISEPGENLALISAPYMRHDLVQGSLGVLGPTRMHYERAITAVAYVAQLFSESLSKI